MQYPTNKHRGLFIILILLSCQSKVQLKSAQLIKYPSSENIPVLVHSEIPVLGSIHPKTIGLIDTTMVVIDKYDPPYIKFYGLSDFHLKASFGKRGDNHGKFMNPDYFNQFFFEGNRVKFFLCDYKKNSIEKFDLLNILKDSNAIPEYVLRLHPSLINKYSSVFVLKDSVLMGDLFANDHILKGRYFTYNIKDHKLSSTGFWPEIREKSKLKISPYYYYSYSAVNFDENKVASAMLRFKRVDFIKANGDAIQITPSVFTGHENIFPNDPSNINPKSGSTTFYVASYGTKTHFYALCMNTTQNNYLQDKGNMELHIFSWEGQLIKEYKLDRLFLGQFCVDEQRNNLYVINFGKDKLNKPILLYHFGL